MFKSSALFEVHVRRDDRWRIEASFTDEKTALSCARAQLAESGVQEVKVLKTRNIVGLGLETEVFHRKATENKERPLTISGSAEGAPYCMTLNDLYGFESRLIVGRLLRQFLDKFRITPTELLYNWTFARKLDEQGSLIGSAIHAVARHHADVHGIAAKERVNDLRRLVDQALIKARDFAAERKRLPAFDEKDLIGTSQRVEQAVGSTNHDGVFLGMLALHLGNTPSVGGKLELLADMMGREGDPQISHLLEGVIADGLGSAEVVKDLLGPQPNLAGGVMALADTVLGRPQGEKDTPVSPLLTRIGRFVAEGRAPCCRTVLVDRIRSAVNSDQPLDRRDAKSEALLVEAVATRLKDGNGTLLGGAETEKALARRLLRHRQAILRQQGMHDIADRLSG